MKPQLAIGILTIAIVAAGITGVYFFKAVPEKSVVVTKSDAQHQIHDDATFEKETKTQGYMPYGKSEMEYEIKVPKDWEADEDLGAKKKLEENTKP